MSHVVTLPLLLLLNAPGVPSAPPVKKRRPASKVWSATCPEGTRTVAHKLPDGSEQYCVLAGSERPVRHGPWVRWNAKGKRTMTGHYRNAKRHGRWMSWHPNGKPRAVWRCENGKWHGRFTRWHPNGNKAQTGHYRNGQKQHCWKSYDTAGELIASSCFVNGARHGRASKWRRRGEVHCWRDYWKGRSLDTWRCRDKSQLSQTPAYRPAKPVGSTTAGVELNMLVTPWRHPTGWAFGMHAIGFFPYGKWVNHRYAGTLTGEDLDQVGPGGGAQLEVGRKWRWTSLFFLFDIAGLSTGQWDRWAAEQGTKVSSRALQYGLNLVLGVDLFHAGRFRMTLRSGIGFMHAWGQEKNPSLPSTLGTTYEYTFLKPSFSFRAGIVGGYELRNGTELVLYLDHSLGAPGVDYGQGGERPYLALTLGLGVRFYGKRHD